MNKKTLSIVAALIWAVTSSLAMPSAASADGIEYPGCSIAANPVAGNVADNQVEGPVPLTVEFTASSQDSTVTYAWILGDGTQAMGENVTHTFNATGTYRVSVDADNHAVGTWNRCWMDVTVTAPENSSNATPGEAEMVPMPTDTPEDMTTPPVTMPAAEQNCSNVDVSQSSGPVIVICDSSNVTIGDTQETSEPTPTAAEAEDERTFWQKLFHPGKVILEGLIEIAEVWGLFK